MHNNRFRLSVNPEGNWRLYAPVRPENMVMLGIVRRGQQVGALARTQAGIYVMLCGGGLSTLPQHKVAAALRQANG